MAVGEAGRHVVVLSWSWRPARGVKKRIDRVYEKAVTMVEGGLKAGEGRDVLRALESGSRIWFHCF